MERVVLASVALATTTLAGDKQPEGYLEVSAHSTPSSSTQAAAKAAAKKNKKGSAKKKNKKA